MTSRMSAILGSAMAEMIRCRKDSCVDLDRRRRQCAASACVPSKRVTSRPSSWREQILFVGGDQFDQVLVERFRSVKDLLSRTAFSASALLRPRFCVRCCAGGGRVVLHLLLHLGIHLAAHRDRMRRAGIGSGRHGRDVARFEHERIRPKPRGRRWASHK